MDSVWNFLFSIFSMMTVLAWTTKMTTCGCLKGEKRKEKRMTAYIFKHVYFRCDEPGEVGSPICMKEPTSTSTTASATSTSTIPPTSSTPEPTSTSYFNRVELHGNGNSSYEGNVYAVNRDEWFGPVCDDGWSETEAIVTCR